MTVADIAAYIGAAAWAPQIIAWAYSTWATPRLTIVSAPTVEIGYSTFGPIVNMTAAISTSRKDALIEKITLEATHEKGERRLLTWARLNELQQFMRAPNGDLTQFQKNQVAIALQVSTLALSEKIIGFQDQDFDAKARPSVEKMANHFRWLKTQSGDALEALLKSKEYREAQDFFDQNMYWKPGRYVFKVSLQMAGQRANHTQSFTVDFSVSDVETIRSNCRNLEDYLRWLYFQGDPKDRGVGPTWHWVSPSIRPA